MIGFVVAIGAILLAVILLLVYRLHTLVNVMRGDDPKAQKKSNRTNAFLMMFFLVASLVLLFWYSITRFDQYHIPIASAHGVATDRLFWITMGLTGFVFLITQILLFWFSYKYQHSEKRRALYFPENNKLEILWTTVPAVVLTFLVLYGLIVWNKITAPAPEDAEVIEIMGFQFAWKVRYPGKDNQLGDYDFRLIDAENLFGMDFKDKRSLDDFSPRELHLPKGRPVELKIRARDVLHSVFAPHFRLKMDAVPGMQTRFTFVPTKSTAEMREETGNPDFNYEIACAEICGKGHFSMRLMVVVDEPEDYEKWKAEQEPWLSKNPDYLTKVPSELRELAMVKANIAE